MTTETGTETSTTPSTDRKGDWIQTYSGRRFWPLDPRPGEVDILDISHALANTCRFTGHCKQFYSVAQHSVLASRVVKPEAALAALLHDAAEAYMGDIARPWKRFLWVSHGEAGQEFGRALSSLKAMELELLIVILEALGCNDFTDATWDEVKRADELLLVTEARDIMAPLVDQWRHQPKNGFEILPDRISPWGPGRACYEFRKRFTELTGK
ncbi:Uncharacterized protein OS=Fibrella aestuarina BUZ 2 GN=yfdR PE=4 SV=1 [Gemmataceae bacterium]|nr:Uncharacterized protein OS=Fibrella aestuarina BUZ 2 GN=yfdR PE=4 SV=1 [Gemmataceae bacterium]VTU01022.1 Uncharacterized protein OS=Fibrella aestuarina BUZ 2 GN=yfdR PE=4 SV=1 [Gemmataceae bacterium]